MLMMETLNDGYGELQEAQLSAAAKSEEATLFYLDTFSESLFLTVNLSLTFVRDYKKTLDFFHGWMSTEES